MKIKIAVRFIKLFLLGFSFFLSKSNISQELVYSEILKGGIIGIGVADTSNSTTQFSHTFTLNFPIGSTIKNAYLIVSRHGNPDNKLININGIYYQLSKGNVYFNSGYPSIYGGIGNIHFIDVKNSFQTLTTNFNLTLSIPSQPLSINSSNRYNEYYFVISYKNSTYNNASCLIFLDKMSSSIDATKLKIILPTYISNNDIGLALISGYICDTLNDGVRTYINNTYSGLIGGNDNISGLCGGPLGCFEYSNNNLYGLTDDSANYTFNGSDLILKANSYLNSSDSISISFVSKSIGNSTTNFMFANILTYTTPCDTFSTSLSKDTTICIGQTAQLNATGGTKYEWQPQQNLSCYNCPNPTFTGTQTTTYTCRIYNGDSCSKVLPVRIIVQNPKADSLLLTKAFCPNNNGTAQIFADTLLWGKLGFTINGNINNTGNFTNLTPGWHNYTITDTLGCAVTDSFFIQAQVNVNAAFTANPKTGFAPLTVNFTNLSNNSTTNYWLITNQQKDTLLSTSNFQPSTFNFTQSGTYTTTLIACNNPPYCCDTISFTILVEDSAAILLPNVFSPNQDGVNDDYQIQLQAAWHFETLQAQIYNRWGEVLQERKFTSTINPIPSNITLWDGFTPAGTPATAGTYFIVVNATLKDGKKISSRIAVSLVR